MSSPDTRLTRIGVFYDGNYFFHVSNYYHYNHERRARISVSGLHEFIRDRVSKSEGCDLKYCRVVDAHYFRGRPKAQDAEQRGTLVRERIFDDVLVREGVVTHYLPLAPEGEKGIDVWLALEAYELAINKRFDVIVLVVCDGDFLPLVRKLTALGTRVMLLAWDFTWVDQNNQERETRTAQTLLDEVTYLIKMHKVIDDCPPEQDAVVNNIFMPPKELRDAVAVAARESASLAAPGSANTAVGEDDRHKGAIYSLKEGFGFITPANGGQNIFFHHSAVMNADFSELEAGDQVRYEYGQNEKGVCAIKIQIVD
jgi:cold shock CspA family protein